VTLIRGAFNVILDASSGAVMPGAAVNELRYGFGAANRFLGLTILRDASGQAVADPRELVPRQQILSAPFALVAQQAATVRPGAINTESLTPGLIQSSNLADRIVSLSKLAPRIVSTNAPIGGIAMSLPILRQRLTASTFQDITNLTVTIQTTGRPVLVFLVSMKTNSFPANPGELEFTGLYFIIETGASYGHFRLLRDGGQAALVASFGSGAGGSTSVGSAAPVGSFLDFPDAGTHQYKLQWGFTTSSGQRAELYNQVLVAMEL
jgi:hypothetical protein